MSAALEMKPKRVVFPIAGKGGVGKTTVMATLAEWYASTIYTADLFDMDPDNKAEGSFKALFAKSPQAAGAGELDLRPALGNLAGVERRCDSG